jgi:ferredoxin
MVILWFKHLKLTAMSADFLPKIDIARCIGCELCVRICPHKVLALVDNLPKIVNPEVCDYTGACQEVCPSGAISLIYEITFAQS